jgi:hypothetical protein
MFAYTASPRADLSALPVLIDLPSIQGTETCNIESDSDVNASYLYVMNRGEIRVVADPGGVPRALGTLGFGARAMTYDKIDHALYFLDWTTYPAGRVMKLQ